MMTIFQKLSSLLKNLIWTKMPDDRVTSIEEHTSSLMFYHKVSVDIGANVQIHGLLEKNAKPEIIDNDLVYLIEVLDRCDSQKWKPIKVPKSKIILEDGSKLP